MTGKGGDISGNALPARRGREAFAKPQQDFAPVWGCFAYMLAGSGRQRADSRGAARPEERARAAHGAAVSRQEMPGKMW